MPRRKLLVRRPARKKPKRRKTISTAEYKAGRLRVSPGAIKGLKDKFSPLPFKEMSQNLGIAYSTINKKGLVTVMKADTMNLPLAAAKRGIGFEGVIFGVNELKIGLDELINILESDRLTDIAFQVYNQTVIPMLKALITEHGARNIQKGSGGAGKGAGKKFLKLAGRTNLQQQWTEVLGIITGPPRKVARGKIRSFTLNDLLSVEIDPTTTVSKYRKVYLMIEFGTGEFARPGPRKHVGTGITPYKVSPEIASALGGKTSWWFNWPGAVLKARAVTAAYKSATKSKKKLSKNVKNFNLAEWTYGHDNKGFRPLHLLFDARGFTRNLRNIQEANTKALYKRISEEVRKKVPGWPDITLGVVAETTINKTTINLK